MRVLFSKAYLKYDARGGAGGITALTPAAQYKLGHRNKGSSNKVQGFCPEVARFATARDKELLHSEALNTNRSFNQVEDLITSEFLKWCKIGQCSQQKPHIPPKTPKTLLLPYLLGAVEGAENTRQAGCLGGQAKRISKIQAK